MDVTPDRPSQPRREHDDGDHRWDAADEFDDNRRASVPEQFIGEVVVICLECRRVKSAGDDWRHDGQNAHPGSTLLSHGYCPGCFDALLATGQPEQKG